MEFHDAGEAMGMRKILAHDIRVKKNPQTKVDTFWIFTDFHGVIRVQSTTLNPRTEISSMVWLTAKLSICCYFFTLTENRCTK